MIALFILGLSLVRIVGNLIRIVEDGDVDADGHVSDDQDQHSDEDVVANMLILSQAPEQMKKIGPFPIAERVTRIKKDCDIIIKAMKYSDEFKEIVL